MTVMAIEQNETAREHVALKKEQAYIRQLLGVEEVEEVDSASETTGEGYSSSCDELDDNTGQPKSRCTIRSVDGGYISFSDEDSSQENINKCVSFTLDLNVDNDHVVNEVDEKKNYLDLPIYLEQLLEGVNESLPDDYTVPVNEKPDWLDMKKLKIGQEFAKKYYFGVNFSEMLSLMVLFSFPNGLEPLIFTRKSGTPFTAFRRYLSTSLRVKSWFEHDIWNENSPGFKNLKTVRAMHLNTSKKLNSTPHDKLKSQLTVTGPLNETPVWCTLKDQLKEDFRSSCPFQTFKTVTHKMSEKIYINQLEMSVTQFGFMGLMTLYPDKFGASSATEEELDGFIHLWRAVGYLLGVKDKYNFCNGTLEEVRQRSSFVIDNWIKPNFRDITEEWEHMSRCVVEGISYYITGVNFEVSLLYLCWVLGVEAPRLYDSLSWPQYYMFLLTKMIMCFTLRIPGMLPLHNWLTRRAIQRAASMSPEKLAKLERKIYDYEQEKGSFNTKL